MLLLIGSLWLLAGCALSAPPPSREGAPIITPQPPVTANVEFQLPARTPSVTNGAAIYAEKCAGCHGASGRGDGPQASGVASQFGTAPANLTADNVARVATAAEWFAMISGGRLENGMPPFSGSLSTNDIWDVIAYVWSLGTPQSTLARGQAVYAERCVQCHGETGKGDGPQADGSVPDLSDLAQYEDVAPGAWDNALQSTHVPSFSGKLSSVERSAVVDYIRSFTYDAAAVVAEAPPAETPSAPEATSAPQPSSGGLTVNGSVVNDTGGANTPGNLEGTFYHFPGGLDSVPITQTVTIDAQGRFSLPDVQAESGDVLAANVQYGDISYWSDPVTFDGTAAAIDLPVRVFEQTTDTAAIHIDTLHIIARENSGALDVIEAYILSNQGDRTVANTSEPTLRFNLPAGATAFQGMSDIAGVYAQTPEGFVFREAVLPGTDSTQVIVSYQLPLDGEVRLDRVLTYPANSVNLLVQATDMTASSDLLAGQGLQDFQGESYQVFVGGALAAGQPLSFRLAAAGAGVDAKLIGGLALLLVGVAVVGFGVWRSRGREAATVARPAPARKPAQAARVDRDQLLDEIAALDDRFETGEIDEASYRRQREAMKSQLTRLMREE